MMRKTLFPLTALIVLLGLVALGVAQEKKTTLTGYLVDKACSAGQRTRRRCRCRGRADLAS